MLRDLLALLLRLAWYRAVVPAILVTAVLAALYLVGFVVGAVAGLW